MRLEVDGQRIVAADAPGLERDLVGLTLLEAAAVGGETLAVDALANAIGPAIRAARDPQRTAVAMSGGVDSAVALLAAGDGRRRASRSGSGSTRTPPASERVCCSPAAVIAARETCHRLGLPHVTLDLREEFRSAVVAALHARLRARRDAEPVRPLQRQLSLRRAAPLRPPDRRRRGSRPATTRGSSSATAGLAIARAADAAKDQSYMLATLDRPRASTGSGSRSASRRRRRRARRPRRPGSPSRAGRRARRRASSAATTTATFLGRHGSRADAGPVRRRDRHAQLGTPRRVLALHPGPAPRARRRGVRAALRGRDRRRARTPSSSVRAHRSRGAVSRCAAALDAGATRVEAKLRHRSPAVGATVARDAARLRAPARRAALRRRAAGRPPCSTRTTPSSGAGVIVGSPRLVELRSPRCSRPPPPTTPTTPSPVFLVVVGLGARLGAVQARRPSSPRRPRSSAAPSARSCP